ncbi:dynein light chain roadblock-type 1-like [Clytia hemisphaerica]|uniref:Roadblock/LAMTOR2 domain-containing protein n=1 Tax=Clytia hemisphaerica TaxID=252671 RepID=A0A7M5V501_9CNID
MNHCTKNTDSKCIERIISNSTVKELISYDSNGIIVHTTIDNARAQLYRNAFQALTYTARKAVKIMDPNDELKFIRMRVKGIEIIIAPDVDGTLAILQNVAPYDPPHRPPKEIVAQIQPNNAPPITTAPEQGHLDVEENIEEAVKTQKEEEEDS